MTPGPIVKAVTTATKAQIAADLDGTPAQFDSYWQAFTPSWLTSNNEHFTARARDEAVKGRAA
jgi:hypothetical protein